MIARLRELCAQEARLVAAMLYGSFTRQEGDRYADIECLLYFQDEHLPDIDPQAWVSQIAPVALYFVNEFGVGTAIFHNLVRGEFHFDPASQMAVVESWQGLLAFPSLETTLLLDRTGELTRRLGAVIGPPPRQDAPEQVQALINRAINWSLFGLNVLARGELLRALELLNTLHRHLLFMLRLRDASYAHWLTPSKSAEQDLPAADIARLATCTAPMRRADLWRAYLATWAWLTELMRLLEARYPVQVPHGLLAKIGRYAEELASESGIECA
jgi:lincosamide nucleotidyltransferase